MSELGYAQFTLDDVDKILTKNKDTLMLSLKSTLKNVFDKCLELQECGIKNKPRYVYISFLRTGIKDKQKLFRVDIYDNRKFIDLIECSDYWDVSVITDTIYSKALVEDYTKSIFNKQSIELEECWTIDFDMIYSAMKNMINDLLSAILADECFNGFHSVRIYFGEFLGATEYCLSIEKSGDS